MDILPKISEKTKRYLNALKGLLLVENKMHVIRHILGFGNEKFVQYCLKQGLRLEVPNAKRDRTTILSLNEILGEEIYMIPFSNKRMTVIDLGAQAGIYSLYVALRNENARIYALEPDPDNFGQLCRNIELNGFMGRIMPIEKAIGGEDKESVFYVSGQSSRASSLLRTSDTKAPFGISIKVEEITLQTLFSMINIQECDVLKVDIEGAEYEALYDSPSEILQRINRICMECHDLPDSAHVCYNKQGMKRFLSNNGFEIVRDNKQTLIAQRIGH